MTFWLKSEFWVYLRGRPKRTLASFAIGRFILYRHRSHRISVYEWIHVLRFLFLYFLFSTYKNYFSSSCLLLPSVNLFPSHSLVRILCCSLNIWYRKKKTDKTIFNAQRISLRFRLLLFPSVCLFYITVSVYSAFVKSRAECWYAATIVDVLNDFLL